MRCLSFLAVLSLILCGCAGSRTIFSSTSTIAKKTPTAPGTLPITPRVLEQLPVERYCLVQMLGDKGSYAGKIVSVDRDRLTIDEVNKVNPETSKMTLADVSLPFLPKRERQVKINGELLDGCHALPRNEIAHVKILDFQASDEYSRHRHYAVHLKNQIDQRRRVVDGDPQREPGDEQALDDDQLASK